MASQNRTPEQRHAEYLRTRDACIARAKAWREANSERRREYERKRYLENPERKAATIFRTAAYRKAHPEIHREQDRTYRERHKEEIAEYNREYFRTHPEVARQNQHRRRAKKLVAPFEFFKCNEIYERDGWNCGICKLPIDRELKHPNPMSVSLDHIIPLSRGGHHLRENCQAAHLCCNKRKNNLLSA